MAKSRTPRTATRKAAGKGKAGRKAARGRKAVRTLARKAKKAAKKKAATKKVARKAARKAASRRPMPTAARRKTVQRKAAAKAQPKPRNKTKAAPRNKTKAAKAARKPARTAAPAASAARPAAATPRTARPSPPVRKPALDRERRRLPEASLPPSPPSSLGLDQRASAAKSGRREIQEHLSEHTETGPVLTAGDVDANWESAYSTGDEAPGGDNPTPDQDVVDEIGRSLGLEYEDNEELKGAGKLEARDKHRWELDPASSEDYKDRE